MPDDTTPRIINFDTLTVGYVEVTKTRGGQTRTWKLRDDVPSEILMRFFELGDAAQAERSEESVNAPAQIIASYRTAERIYLAILTDIFCHTYPETTEAELREWFTFDQRKQLVDAFFSPAGIGSNAPSNATPAGGPASTATSSLSAPQGQTNRAARRLHKRKTAN